MVEFRSCSPVLVVGGQHKINIKEDDHVHWSFSEMSVLLD